MRSVLLSLRPLHIAIPIIKIPKQYTILNLQKPKPSMNYNILNTIDNVNMRHSMLFRISILLMILISNATISAQDTLLLHYSNATISEIIPDDSNNGSITGKGDDASQGKYMYFNSSLHKSPVAELISVLLDLEVSNFSELDSFSVFIQQRNGLIWEDTWEEKFSFSEIDEVSTPIYSNSVAGYNFKIDMSGTEIFDIGSLDFNVGIRYSYDSDAKISLRATGEGEFLEADNRCFTINEDGSISDFVSQYGTEIGLAIFPVTYLSTGIEEFSAMEIEVINTGNGILIIKSTNQSDNINLSLFNINGNLLYGNQLKSARSVEIDSNILPSGLYILSASNQYRKGSIKLILP